MYEEEHASPQTWPSPAVAFLPSGEGEPAARPEVADPPVEVEVRRQEALFERMYDALSCRPPLKRNWTPILYATAAVTVGAVVSVVLAVLV